MFGAPVAHQDDAERAVRAGLCTLEAIEEPNRGDEKPQLQVRVGINTGEALVALGATPSAAKAWSPATSSTLLHACRNRAGQSVAVSEPTFHQTERVFTFVRLTGTRLMVMLLRDCSGHSPTFAGTRTLQAL